MRWGLVIVFMVAVVAFTSCGTNANAGFCSTHACIPNFNNGHGSIVECNDGEWSHSGGEPGACSYHGGEK